MSSCGIFLFIFYRYTNKMGLVSLILYFFFPDFNWNCDRRGKVWLKSKLSKIGIFKSLRAKVKITLKFRDIDENNS